MQTGKGQVIELILQDGLRSARLSCPGNLIPSPGQYLLAGDDSASLLPVPLFYTDSAPSGFIAAPPLPESWNPGHQLLLRGPLGRGFRLPIPARRVVLVAYDDMPARLRGLIRPALKQNAAVVLICDAVSNDLPDDVEVQPLSALSEVCEWADYVALDVARENLPGLRKRLDPLNQVSALKEAQLLIRTPMPCGGVAECGVCAVPIKSSWRMACKEGPVFDWGDIRE
ncbi:MAG: iron-sulfur cluster-binding protein [Anaerolineales bacterium]